LNSDVNVSALAELKEKSDEALSSMPEQKTLGQRFTSSLPSIPSLRRGSTTPTGTIGSDPQS
jgi:hypothetical protein